MLSHAYEIAPVLVCYKVKIAAKMLLKMFKYWLYEIGNALLICSVLRV